MTPPKNKGAKELSHTGNSGHQKACLFVRTKLAALSGPEFMTYFTLGVKCSSVSVLPNSSYLMDISNSLHIVTLVPIIPFYQWNVT